MASVLPTLRAMERRAERALMPELRLMAQQLRTSRNLLLPAELAYADALLLKLDRLMDDQLAAPAVPADAQARLAA